MISAFERALEQNWDAPASTECRGPRVQIQSSFKSFYDLRDPKLWMPVLLLNGTHEETGKRTITSHVRINQGDFFDAYDFADLTHRDIALSTAVLNSSRFPFVSPAGALTIEAENQLNFRGHIIDGGFFENNGALTLQEVAIHVREELIKKSGSVSKWTPMIIEILNDTQIDETDLARRAHSLFGTRPELPLPYSLSERTTTTIANELVSPVLGLYNTRAARAVLASKSLAGAFGSDGVTVQFRLCPHMNPSPPLGWLLTPESTRAMDDLVLGHDRNKFETNYASAPADKIGAYLKCFAENQQQLASVIFALNRR